MKLLLLLMPMLVFAVDYSFENESQLSTVKTGGNSDLSTYNLQTDSTGTRDDSSLNFGGHYTLGTGENDDGEKIESARNWDIHLKYAYQYSKKLGTYVGVKYEGDEFSGYDQRDNYDAGMKYIIEKTDKISMLAEAGYRYTVEKLTTAEDGTGGDDQNFSKLRFYYEIAKKVTPTFSYKFWTEYLPNLDEPRDNIITFEPSISVILDDTFSLKVAYKGIYDNQPNIEGNEYLDYTQSTSLIAKF